MKRFVKRSIITLAIIIVLVLAGAGGWLYWRTHVCLPQLDGTVLVKGLTGPVEVLRDARGVPHIRARSLADALFAQGYVTAQDRLWQMDLNRRLAEGQLSEIFGERTLRYDIENRTLGFPEVCARGVTELDPDSRRLLGAYVQGINSFVESHRDRLPIEFMMLRYQPRPWREMDSLAVVLNMMKTLNWTWPADLMRERIHSKIDELLYTDLFPSHSALDHPVAELPKRLAPYGEEPQNASRTDPADLGPTLGLLLSPWMSSAAGVGSNNWVLSGAHTKSGRPLLANDPHLGYSIPSVWYMIHLEAPGLNVTGVSLPGLPLVVIGHNERIAWGMTNTGPDVQDLYAESFNFRDPNKYLHNGQWVDATIRHEIVKVRNKADYDLTVKVTHHGPIISHAGDRDLALCWTALQPHALQFPLLQINQAQNWQDFTKALHSFTGPTQNFVYADVNGNIGFYAAGWIPIRRQGDGSVPVPGSTDDYDWTGTIPFEDLPHSYNPPSGVIATANGRIVPDGYPHFITDRWDAPFRTARIYQLLEQGSAFTVPDMLHIQTDIFALEDLWIAKRLLTAGQHYTPEDPNSQYALSILPKWDGEARMDSAATLVCEVARHALLDRLVRPKLGEDLSGYDWPMSPIFVENVINNSWFRWLPPGDTDFDMTMIRSLEEGVSRIPGLVHSRNRAAWKWGETIPLIIRHPLSNSIPLLGRFMNVGPVPQSGMKTTVKQTTTTVGPSMRMAVDFSNFDDSVQNIVLGESGQGLSPYYRDQFQAWYTGHSFSMLFSETAVDQGTTHKLVLEPTGR